MRIADAEQADGDSGHTFIRLQNAGQKVEDLAAGKALGEGLDGMPPMQKYHSISSLQALTTVASLTLSAD